MIFKSYSLSCKSLGLVRLDTSHPRTCPRALHNTCSNYHATTGAAEPPSPRPHDAAARPPASSSPPQQTLHCHWQTQQQRFQRGKRLKRKFLRSIKARKTLAAALLLPPPPLQAKRGQSGGGESPFPPRSSLVPLQLGDTTGPSGDSSSLRSRSGRRVVSAAIGTRVPRH